MQALHTRAAAPRWWRGARRAIAWAGALLVVVWPAAGADDAANEPALPGHPARFWERRADRVVQCQLCPRQCVLPPGRRGVCLVRINAGGDLRTLGYGNPVALHMDPIEKKPFFHVTPGAQVFSLAVAGCNMRCRFCQNWQISQVAPDEVAAQTLSPEQVVAWAVARGSRFIVYTYTEPTVFYEYMLDIARLARARGLRNGMHSCGYIRPEPLRDLLPYMDAINIDLKGFNPDFYRKMGALAELEPVLECLRTIHAAGVWLEITNLVIPGANDDPGEIRRMCEWIRSNLGPDVPLHFSRFSPAFRLRNLPPTPLETLTRAREIALAAGLRFVYIGNVPGNPAENTTCPGCGKVIIRRVGYRPEEVHLRDGACAFCGHAVPGRWAFPAAAAAAGE
jgi:pyruvate formate lyase activating enzyme